MWTHNSRCSISLSVPTPLLQALSPQGDVGTGYASPFNEPADFSSIPSLDQDPTKLRQTLFRQRTFANASQFVKAHEHPGIHPYRVVLGNVSDTLVQQLIRIVFLYCWWVSCGN